MPPKPRCNACGDLYGRVGKAEHERTCQEFIEAAARRAAAGMAAPAARASPITPVGAEPRATQDVDDLPTLRDRLYRPIATQFAQDTRVPANPQQASRSTQRSQNPSIPQQPRATPEGPAFRPVTQTKRQPSRATPPKTSSSPQQSSSSQPPSATPQQPPAPEEGTYKLVFVKQASKSPIFSRSPDVRAVDPVLKAEPLPDQPWHPFPSRTDFEFAEFALDADLTAEQVDALLALIRRITSNPADLTFNSHKDVRKAWDNAASKQPAVCTIYCVIQMC